MTKPEIAYIALGSNLGDSAEVIARAIVRLQKLSSAPILSSSLWGSSPVDCPPNSPPFINAVVGIIPHRNETPGKLLRKLRALEKKFGRKRKKILNEPRPLDLDLIAFGERAMKSARLILPHPRAHLRRFVLRPLSEIAPDLVLPGQTKPVRRLLRELKTGERLKRLRA
jgi:2-amino-4-hydroxy-6-hydroxymethyldihydropteridine diphosphokinase